MARLPGKNDSIESSSTVMSTGVPNVVTVEKKRSSPSGTRRRIGTTTSPAAPGSLSSAGAG